MSSLQWKRRAGRIAGLWPATRQRRVILLYHALGDTAPSVTVARFRAQLAWLADHATLVSLDSLLDSPGSGLQVALSFDDGYASLHDLVAPALPAGVAATVYLNSGLVADDVRRRSDPALGHYPDQHFLLWREVAALANAGWTIGSHGVEHLDLSKAALSSIDHELVASKAAIEARLQRECAHFAYTWGRFTPRLQQRVMAAGYRSAASGLHGPVKAGSDRFALPRIDVRAEYDIGDFAAAVSGQWDFLGLKQRLQRVLA